MILLTERPAVTVDCPDCQGAGETTVLRSEERNEFGVWDRDTETCTGCGGHGVVPAEEAIEVTCCTTDEQRAEIVRLYGTGLSHNQVARRVGLSANTVGRITRAAGVEGRRSGYAGRDTLTSVRQRLDELGVSAADVRAWAAEAGIPCSVRGIPAARVIDAYAERRAS